MCVCCKVMGSIHEEEEVIGLEHGFVGSVGRIRIDRGWVNLNVNGAVGDRYFILKQATQPLQAGKLRLRVIRQDESLNVVVLQAKDLHDVGHWHLRARASNVSVVVVVNDGLEKRTAVITSMHQSVMWGSPTDNNDGETLTFDALPRESIKSVVLRCVEDTEDGTSNVIGECMLPLSELMHPERESNGKYCGCHLPAV